MKYPFVVRIDRATAITTIIKPGDIKLAIIFFQILRSVESWNTPKLPLYSNCYKRETEWAKGIQENDI